MQIQEIKNKLLESLDLLDEENLSTKKTLEKTISEAKTVKELEKIELIILTLIEY